jgi:putative redox protein
MSITACSAHNYQVEISAGNHKFLSDEPLGIGDDLGPSPFDLLLSALASCIIITVQMYARRKCWPIDKIEAQCEMHNNETKTADGNKIPSTLIEIQLSFHGDLTLDQIMRLTEIASRCPVHRFLKGDIHIKIHAAD